jgi:hypothetical protein
MHVRVACYDYIVGEGLQKSQTSELFKKCFSYSMTRRVINSDQN